MAVHLEWSWELEIQYNPEELGEPYELYFFINSDSIPPAPADWRASPSRLFEPISSLAHGPTTEYRFLNGYLEEFCKEKLEDKDVVSYLRKHLSWRAKKRYEDTEIDVSRLKWLKVSAHGPDGAGTLGD